MCKLRDARTSASATLVRLAPARRVAALCLTASHAGANGFTGRLVAEHLAKHYTGSDAATKARPVCTPRARLPRLAPT